MTDEMIRNKKEIKELEEELSKITGFISDYGIDGEFNDKDFSYSCNITDALSWVLEEISTEHFRSNAYLDIDNLKKIVEKIEKRTGVKLENYE